MAGYIKVDAQKLPTQPINTQINSEIFEEFQRKCKEKGIPMNVPLEVFMAQFSKGRYPLDKKIINKWRNNNEETSTLNTPVNKQIYREFKNTVKANGLFVKYVISAFIEDYAKYDLVMEFVKCGVVQ